MCTEIGTEILTKTLAHFSTMLLDRCDEEGKKEIKGRRELKELSVPKRSMARYRVAIRESHRVWLVEGPWLDDNYLWLSLHQGYEGYPRIKEGRVSVTRPLLKGRQRRREL